MMARVPAYLIIVAEAHNYADGNWLVPGAPPPGQGLELSPSWNPGLEVIRNGSAEWILRARAGMIFVCHGFSGVFADVGFSE